MYTSTYHIHLHIPLRCNLVTNSLALLVCLLSFHQAGIIVIIVSIPITARISQYLKELQKELSTIRDSRIKLSNEVLAGMKVIKLQAWESQMQEKLNHVRDEELTVYYRYIIVKSASAAFFGCIPLLVALSTFALYIADGTELDVATALTALSLFDILRFPLFMLPTVINNIVEAKVSVDRVQSFLLEEEKTPITSGDLANPGAKIKKGTFVWKSVGVASSEDKKMKSFQEYITSAKKICQHIMNLVNQRNTIATEMEIQGSGDIQLTPILTEEELNVQILTTQLDTAENIIEKLSSEIRELRKSEDDSQHALNESGEISGVASFFMSPSATDVRTSPTTEVRDDGEMSEVKIDFNNDDDVQNPLHQHEIDDTSNQQGNRGAGPGIGEGRLITLSRVSMEATPGSLTAIVGQTGSGKSSVLSALLGEIRKVYGNVYTRGSIAYVGQQPFIQNSTVRENIIFGCPFNLERYDRACTLSALQRDLKVLPGGDMTEIGERGINLSGGQKARVALARAVYSNADLYFLDDTLSAVDAHVGQHIFDKCIVSLRAQGKCVVLVTNALHHLSKTGVVDHIIVLKQGRIVESGSYHELITESGVFSEMINAYQDSVEETSLSKPTSLQDLAIAVETSMEEAKFEEGEESQVDEKKEDPNIENSKKSSEIQKTNNNQAQLINEEDREVGDVDFRVYKVWTVAAGGIMTGVLMVGLCYFVELVYIFSGWWLSYWSEDTAGYSAVFYLTIYAIINCAQAATSWFREFFIRTKAWYASRQLYRQLCSSVLYSPMSFYDTTPLGRVLNRFSKDIYTIDEQLPDTARMYIITISRITLAVLYTCLLTPLFIIGLIPIVWFYRISQNYYIRTSRELTRLENTSRSPIYALFTETLDGLATVRAYRQEKRLTNKSNALLDSNIAAYFLNFSSNCWLAVRLEFAGTLIITFTALAAVIGRDVKGETSMSKENFAGLAGLAISFAMNITQSINWSVRMASDLESQMVSVERIVTYSGIEQEAPHSLSSDPKGGWPHSGGIRFENVCMRYRPGLPLVLKGLTLSINPGEKIGIVGRTGAGKSSLVTAVLRLVELDEGAVYVDSIDVSKVGLNTLRSKVAVIPQDPVLFSGTVRSNIDPFLQYADEQIWDVLNRCCLREVFNTLDDKVDESGGNLSVGQRQLICIARALLSKCCIIIMDEATASVDVETDAVIQRTIRSDFNHATVLTIAHRLNTIMDSDKVLVMDDGQVGEYDTPAELLQNTGGMFAGLVKDWEQNNQ